VIDCDNATQIALVEFNGLKFKLPYAQLIVVEGVQTKQTLQIDYIKYDVVTKIDLRGYRADEALRALDEFIDNALLNNIDYLTILHGKGTGALKQTIHDFLSRHPAISSFRLGEIVEGGAGVNNC
jgi:DNA mismatch repair protein MutS2